MTPSRSSLRAACAVAAAALITTGCGVFSPVQTDAPYVPADGLPLSIPGMEFRNLVVVVDEEGGDGVLVGQALNPASTPVRATFGVEDGPPASIVIPARVGDGITAVPSRVDLGPVSARPGAMVTISVTTAEAGRNVVLVPVLPPAGVYEGIEPGGGDAQASNL